MESLSIESSESENESYIDNEELDNSSHSESESSEYARDSNSGEENTVISDGYTCVEPIFL